MFIFLVRPVLCAPTESEVSSSFGVSRDKFQVFCRGHKSSSVHTQDLTTKHTTHFCNAVVAFVWYKQEKRDDQSVLSAPVPGVPVVGLVQLGAVVVWNVVKSPQVPGSHCRPGLFSSDQQLERGVQATIFICGAEMTKPEMFGELTLPHNGDLAAKVCDFYGFLEILWKLAVCGKEKWNWLLVAQDWIRLQMYSDWNI